MFGYLFERFPSFTQTFCAREVAALRGHGVEAPVFSIRNPGEEPIHQAFPNLGPTTYLPAKFDDLIASDASFRRAARKGQELLKAQWGSESEKRRIHESLWLERACRASKIHHLHTHFAGLSARTAFWLRRQGGPNYSVTAHANDIFRDEPPERLAQVLGEATCVVTVSDFSRDYLLREHPHLAGKLHRVYNGIDIARFRKSPIPGDRPLIVSVGRAIEKKGFCDVIEACGLLHDIDFECVIVGGGPLEENLMSQTEALGLQGRVKILGARAEEDIRELLTRARVFILPCVTGSDGAMDNLPTVIMEAMASGIPVISTPLAGIPEMVKDGTTGFLVPERQPAQLADKLRRLLMDRDLAATQGAAGWERCRELFAIERTSAALLEILETHGALPARP
ncbi:MAG: glycosyltransferase family 4 protein [Terrimicrobiaceae bacterium]